MNRSAQPRVRDFSRSHEPIAWSLFGAGGVVAALVTPVLIVITGLMLPLGVDADLLGYERVLGFVQAWWGKLFILVAISLPLYHAAHRIYHGLHDLHIHLPRLPMLLVCYGAATVLTGLTILLLLFAG